MLCRLKITIGVEENYGDTKKMKQYVSLDKRSKKAQKEYHAKQRRTWGDLNPVTRSVPSGKVYNRKKEKQRIGVESRNGFDAEVFVWIFL